MGNIEYMCRLCGRRIIRSEKLGQPAPGICPKRKGMRIDCHSWIKNRRL